MTFSILVALCVVSVASGCGVPSITPNFPAAAGTHIVGGKDSKANSWPWQANLRSISSNYQFCGGSLIHPQFVLTAGHCYYRDKPADNSVGLGYHHKNADGDTSSSETINVKTIIMHESYNDRTLDNDICLLQLDKPVTLSSTIDLVCLPDGPIADKEEVYITGWGDNEKFIQPTYLQEAAVQIINRGTCNQRDWYNGEISEVMICAGFEQGGIDTCQGDSGGPLVHYEKDPGHEHFVLHGITSWGYGCADAKNPGVYTEVWDFVPWINEKIAQYGG